MEQLELKEIIEWVLDHWASVTAVICMLVEITPIKINPLGALLKWIGKAINGEVIQRMTGVEKRLDEQRRSIDENEMDRIRWEIFDFANECRNNVRHTKDEFHHIIALNSKYHALLDKYDEENGVFDAEYKYILELYEKCQHENDFL